METLNQIEKSLTRAWRTLAGRGLIAILFGVVLLAWPDLSLRALVLTFGAFATAHGILGIVGALRSKLPAGPRSWLVLQGLVSIAFGAVAFIWPDMTELALLYVIGAWAIVFGVFEIGIGLGLPLRRSTSLLFVLNGLLAIVFGVVMFWRPETGALALVVLIATLAIAIGTTMILYAFELRKATKQFGRRVREAEVASSKPIEPVAQS